jgi:hypothetical protein
MKATQDSSGAFLLFVSLGYEVGREPVRMARFGPRLVFIAIGLFGLCLNLFGHACYALFPGFPLRDFFCALLAALGEAALVAAILAVTVDGLAKAHFLREVARDFAPYLFGWRLPPAVVERIKETFSTSLVAFDRTYDYRLEEIPGDDDRLNVSVTVAYRVTNFSGTNRNYTPELSVWHRDEPQFGTLTVMVGSRSYGGFEKDTWKQFQRARARQAITIPPDGEARVRWEYTAKSPRDYTEINSWPLPVIGVTITANCPPGIAFECDPDPSLIQSGPVWHYKDRLYWTSEYIRVRWFPRGAQEERAGD